MFGIFKKKTRKAITEVKKMENRDAVEATVWGAYSIAYADGTCDAKEIAVLEKTIAALPAFAPFSGEIAQMSANIRARYEASPRSANAEALRQLADVAGNQVCYEQKTLDTQNAANNGEMGTGSDTSAFFLGGMRQHG
ncbi:TPA: tellurite/colicin resistance protein [Escherichia coli]